jgi:glycosyltransferase involved in cell wall biosynthesis
MNVLKSRPKVTIDVGPLFEDMWTGIPVFTRRLVQSLLRHGGVDVEFSFNLTRIPPDRVLAAIHAGTGSFLREDFEKKHADEYGLVDRNSHLLFPSVKGRLDVCQYEASTVHDMSTLVMPENHEEANISYHLDDLCDELTSNELVFCVSEATRAALITSFPSASTKARVLYQYADWPDEFEVLDHNQPPISLGRFAVVVGTIEPRKNLSLLINALSMPEVMRSDLKFVVIGRKGWLVDKFLTELSTEARNRLLFSGFVSEFIKYRLIKAAEFLIFPSLYEGFGIPALEAMSLGKPVLAARTSSFPEVIADAGVYFDPLSTSEFAAAFAEIESEGRIRELAPKAIAQCATFGWQRMAAPVVEWVSG